MTQKVHISLVWGCGWWWIFT